jgi:hypothetical protein
MTPTGPAKYAIIIQGIENILGTIYFKQSLAIHVPVNKLMARKCSQKTNLKVSLV